MLAAFAPISKQPRPWIVGRWPKDATSAVGRCLHSSQWSKLKGCTNTWHWANRPKCATQMSPERAEAWHLEDCSAPWSDLVPSFQGVTLPKPGPPLQGPGRATSGCQAVYLVWNLPLLLWAYPLEESLITHLYRPFQLCREAYLPSHRGLWGKGILPIWGPSPPREVTAYSACISLFIPQPM